VLAVANFPVVGIGASAGGLDACRKLLDALPPASGMAFILVQHLDPTHESLMTELLASHTSMSVQQATHGMIVEPDHLYVIPPGCYLAVRDGALQLSKPGARHGARLPFDFLLRALADAYGPHAAGIVLSGTGSDGTLGAQAIKDKGGYVIAQSPDDADYDGMPRSVVLTGVVDVVCQAAQIPDAIARWRDHVPANDSTATVLSGGAAADSLQMIIDLVRARTPHDFSSYKIGTMQRRIERRMALAGIASDDMDRYVDLLRDNHAELTQLAKDLLINVTSFFRDKKVFSLLREKIIPDMVRRHAPGHPIRIWIAGCSTGEEAYSLAIMFREALNSARLNIKLQIFASDADPDVVAFAREGRYPASIEADVSPEQLARFFSQDDGHYVVSPELRSSVVFTVQDVLSDAPFSRLDFVSCRNVLIYLKAEVQAKVLALFHFALVEDGILLLGSSESAGHMDDRFEMIAKSERLYRHIGRSRPGDLGFLIGAGDGTRARVGRNQGPPLSREASLAELCRDLVMEEFAPAAILINRRHECLYTQGPIDRYLHLAPGLPTQELFALARPTLRVKLRSAVHQAIQKNSRITVTGGKTQKGETTVSFNVDVRPVRSEGEDLLLVCFVEQTGPPGGEARAVPVGEAPRVAQLEQELEATRTELQGAISNLELSNEEQKALNEEALSIQEEYQSTNEELLTSKEELQSVNEELTALNNQLQETLERQRTTSNDLQNVLYSTNVATIFLDVDLNIRFFTPATKSLFRIIPGDIGRPLADLNFMAADHTLLADASAVLQRLAPLEREIDGQDGVWYTRRILPYRTQDNGVEGVVITFSDITERRHAADALRAATHRAEMANLAKSRFLAAASHDLRQPLQTLTLLQSLLAKAVEGERAQKMIALLDETLTAMSSMLNTLLDINQIEAGTIRPNIIDFPIADLLGQLQDQFLYHAQAEQLTFHVLPCSLPVRSDPRLLEQMIRNLLTNAFKYTKNGRVLLGCRRRGRTLRIEVWDTGIGIPQSEIAAIFEEYHQLDNPARERGHGMGLGLSIVQRLGNLLGHTINVQSRSGHGSVFSITVPLSAAGASAPSARLPIHTADTAKVADKAARATILAVEDDAGVCDLLSLLLGNLGYQVTTAPDAIAALALVSARKIRPDLILADYNLPGGMDGLRMITRLRAELRQPIPAVILTGDITTSTLREIERQKCALLNKPVKVQELSNLIQRLVVPALRSMPAHAATDAAPHDTGTGTIFIVDDDDHLRATLRRVLEDDGRIVADFSTCEAFLSTYHHGDTGCLLVDAYLPGMNGMELLQKLRELGAQLPAIMITGNSDVNMAVQAMKAGAVDFIEKPVRSEELITSIDRALERAQDSGRLAADRDAAADRLAGLTRRQLEVMELVLAGHPSKNIAADLGISQRTVENHRASIMRRTGAKSLPALARLALAAAWHPVDVSSSSHGDA
jgi:two-component system CheB/CheR fusion protein